MFNLKGGIGIIHSITKEGIASVKFFEEDERIIGDLQILTMNTYKNKEYSMPEVGTPVFCIFLGEYLDRGYVLSSFFSESSPIPEGSDLGKKVVSYPGAGTVTTDPKTGSIHFKFDSLMTFEAPNVKIIGQLGVTKGIEATEDVVAGNVSLIKHLHKFIIDKGSSAGNYMTDSPLVEKIKSFFKKE